MPVRQNLCKLVNVLTLKHHPFEKADFIYDEDMLKVYGTEYK
jgi:hypothetical protein